MNHTELFRQGTEDLPDYDEAIEFVDRMAEGRAWLIGGIVYRTIAEQAYGVSMPFVDFDFIVEGPRTTELPEGWMFTLNSFGNERLSRAGLDIDFIPLTNIDYIKRNRLEPTIDNYLQAPPLTIQSIAYDIQAGEVIGEVGKRALETRTVAVYNLEQAQQHEKLYGISVKDYLTTKAKSLGFDAVN